MLVRSAKKRYTTVITANGDTLYLFAPGFFLNSHMYEVYDRIGDEIEYNDLLNWLRGKYEGDLDKVEVKLLAVLHSFESKGLVSIDSSSRVFVRHRQRTLTESDFIRKYGFFPVTQVDLVLTRSCNLRCSHCYVDFNELNEDSLSVEEWIGICQILSKYGLLSVVLTGGETFEYPDLHKLVYSLLDLDMEVVLLTNGTKVTDQFANSQFINSEKLTIQVSLDGSNEASNDKQRGEGSFKKTVDCIAKLTESSANVVISMVVNSENVCDIYNGSMFKLADSLNVASLGISPYPIEVNHRTIQSGMELSASEALKLVNFIHSCDFSNITPNISISAPPSITKERTLRSDDSVSRPKCRRGSNSFAIRPNGDVVICNDFAEFGLRSAIIGNILINEIESIMSKMKEVQQKIMENSAKIKGVCSICVHFRRCMGSCRAHSYSLYDELDAPHPWCQKLYELGMFDIDSIDANKNYRPIGST